MAYIKKQSKKHKSKAPIEIIVSPLEIAGGVLVTADTDNHALDIAQKQMEEMEARYHGLLEASADPMLVVDEAGRIVLLNVKAEKQFGYNPGELLGRRVTKLIPEGFAERLADAMQTADAGIEAGIELIGLRKDGTEFPIEIMLSPTEAAEGTLITAAIRDISGRKATEKHLAQMEGKYHALLEAAPDAMVVVSHLGRIVLLNAQAEKQFGYRRDELLGQKITNIIPEGFSERLTADGTRTAAESLARNIGTGIELKGRRKDGGEFPIEIMLSPLESTDEILVTAAIRDITRRRESEARYRGLLEAAPDAMVVVNQAGEIVLLNLQAQKKFGYSREELVGQKVTNIIPEGFAERLISDETRTTAEALAQHIGTGIELKGRRKDGGEFPIEIMLSPLESADGILVTAAIRDITKRKKGEADLVLKIAELDRSNAELNHFAYLASHDLQEPLRMVTSYTQLLARRYKGQLGSDADEFIAFAVDGAERMQSLIGDLLIYSRIESRGSDFVDCSSEQALQKALRNLQPQVKGSGTLVVHGLLPHVLADKAQLVQLFQNLVENAIKFRSDEVPQVHVSAVENSSGRCVFSVKDNGLGIDPRHFEKIFGVFQRLHSREKFTGAGIGLAICRKIAERHGGRMLVESQPGLGSTFYFSLAAPAGKS